jgi:hypothetical protein
MTGTKRYRTVPDGETPEEIARYLEEERQSWGQM